MLSGPGTPFDEDGWAAVLSDLRRIGLATSGGSNDLNGDSTDVAQANTTDDTEQAVDAELLRGVPISTVKPTTGQGLKFNSTTGQYEPGTGGDLIATNNLSDVINAATASANLGLQRVSFAATLATATYLGAGSDVVICGVEVFDTASAYNPSTGVFTVPSTGYYQFNVSLTYQDTNFTNGCILSLLQGATSRSQFRAYSGVLAQPMGVSLSVVISATLSDTISLSLNHIGGGGTVTIVTFSGFRISS